MKKWVIRIFLIVTAVECLLVAGIIYSQRSLKSGLFLGTGLTIKNFLLLASVLFIIILAAGMIALEQKKNKNLSKFSGLINNDRWYLSVTLLSIVVLVECIQDFIFLLSDIKYPYYFDYIQLLKSLFPFLLLGVLLSCQTLMLFIYLRRKDNPITKLLQSIELTGVVIFSGLVSILAFFGLSHIGYIAYSNRPSVYAIYGNFAPTSAPLVREQVVIIFIFVIILFLFNNWLGKRNKTILKLSKYDFFLIVILWLTAYLIWVSIPVEENWFLDISHSPVNTIYPSSDAFYYDKEAFNLILDGKFTDTTTHVMYSFFVMILHLIGGNYFLDIIGLQIAVFAFIPVILYKLTAELNSRLAGFFVGLLYIVREWNGLHLAGDINGSLVNQLMTESLAVLGLITFLYLLILWLKDPNHNKYLPMVAGGVIGVTLLIRAELLAVMIAVSAGALIYLWDRKPIWIKGMIRLWIIGFLIITPWMGRNWIRNGYFTLDKGGFIQRRVKEYIDDFGPGNVIEKKETDPFGDYLAVRSPYEPSISNLPSHIASSVWQSVLYLPVSHQPVFSLYDFIPFLSKTEKQINSIFSESYIDRYVRTLPYYWYYWNGSIIGRSFYSLFCTLLFISIGFSKVYRNNKSSTIILSAALFANILIWAAAGYSGGRFIKSVDWITLLFYGVGIVCFFEYLIRVFIPGFILFTCRNKTQISAVARSDESRNRKRYIYLVTSGLVLLGLAPLLCELILPARYSEETLLATMETISLTSKQSKDTSTQNYIEEILYNPNQLIYGKALYPRFFNINETLPDNRKGTIPDADNSRIDFYLIGTQNSWISLPMDQAGQPVHHFSDVIVLGTQMRNSDKDLKQGNLPFIRADVVYLVLEEGKIDKISCSGQFCELDEK